MEFVPLKGRYCKSGRLPIHEFMTYKIQALAVDHICESSLPLLQLVHLPRMVISIPHSINDLYEASNPNDQEIWCLSFLADCTTSRQSGTEPSRKKYGASMQIVFHCCFSTP